jgi:hypothetical protein
MSADNPKPQINPPGSGFEEPQPCCPWQRAVESSSPVPSFEISREGAGTLFGTLALSDVALQSAPARSCPPAPIRQESANPRSTSGAGRY